MLASDRIFPEQTFLHWLTAVVEALLSAYIIGIIIIISKKKKKILFIIISRANTAKTFFFIYLFLLLFVVLGVAKYAGNNGASSVVEDVDEE